MKTHRPYARLFGRMTLALPLLCAAGWPNAHAQTYPVKPIQMIVPFPAGGPVDVVARSFAQILDTKIGQRVAVVNRDGGSTTIGMNALLAAPGDGYTIYYGPVTSLTVHLHWMKGLQFNSGSFVPVCQTFENVFILASSSTSKFTNFESVLADAKARPGALTYGHPGVASSPHLAGAELFQKAGVSLRDVPYRGETPMLAQLLTNEVDLGVVTTGLVTAQNLRPLAVFADKRMPAYPNAPTVKELGFPATPSGYGGLFLRSDTPAEAVAKVESACRDAVLDPGFIAVTQRFHQQADYLSRERFSARIQADFKSKEALLKTVNVER